MLVQIYPYIVRACIGVLRKIEIPIRMLRRSPPRYVAMALTKLLQYVDKRNSGNISFNLQKTNENYESVQGKPQAEQTGFS